MVKSMPGLTEKYGTATEGLWGSGKAPDVRGMREEGFPLQPLQLFPSESPREQAEKESSLQFQTEPVTFSTMTFALCKMSSHCVGVDRIR